MIQEIQFAQGAEFSEANRMRLTHSILQKSDPRARFPVIHKKRNNGEEERLSLTPGEARWLVDVLGRLLRES